jgi:serine phosphatase RsbU (regulator of sigma subunit)
MPSLIITSGTLTGQVFSFSDSAVVGRGQFSDVRLNDPTVSRRHALIRRNGPGYELRDQDSANGTQHRGQRLTTMVSIDDGDELQFGDVKAVFRSAASGEPSLPALAGHDANSTRQRTAVDAQRMAAEAPGLRELLARMKLLCDLGALARGTQDLRDVLNRALAAVLAAFPQVSRAAVYRPSGGAEHFAALAMCANPSAGPVFAELEALLAEALRLEYGLNISDAGARESLVARLRADNLPAAVLAMPLRLGEDTLGVFYLESAVVEHAWRAADQELFVGIAGQLAWLVASQTASAERAIETHDLAVARRVQQHFLPQSVPTVPGYRFVDSYAAAQVLGGGYYDFFRYRDGRHGLVIADVSGKAVSGALYLARLSVQVRVLARNLDGPEELLAGLNRKLAQELEPGMFVTMFAAALDAEAGMLEFANAGHPAPLLRLPDATVGTLGETGALPLGAMNDATFRARRADLPPGSCALFFGAGLEDAHNGKKEIFGKERIVRTLVDSGGGAQAALDALLAEFARFSEGEPQHSDVVLIALAREQT